MKRYAAFILLIIGIASACKNKEQKNVAGKPEEKKNYLGVLDFLHSEIAYVDSLPLGIIKYTTQHNHSDTAYIQAPEFNQIANAFLCDELKPETFEKQYTETSFMDRTTNAATFMYQSNNQQLELKRVDVVATAGDYTNNLSSIYMQKSFLRNDTLVITKLLWNTRKSFEIITSRQYQKQVPVIEQTKVLWNPE